ncbi:MAG: hypothetical protein FWG62_02140, partial [Proteobacteria bacterium]|nr:hypothetical protein [Pseudomonadota bacterium]
RSVTKLGHGPFSSSSNRGVSCFAISVPPRDYVVEKNLSIQLAQKKLVNTGKNAGTHIERSFKRRA